MKPWANAAVEINPNPIADAIENKSMRFIGSSDHHLTMRETIAEHFGTIFLAVKAHCKEIRAMVECVGSQIAGLAASKGWNSLLSLR